MASLDDVLASQPLTGAVSTISSVPPTKAAFSLDSVLGEANTAPAPIPVKENDSDFSLDSVLEFGGGVADVAGGVGEFVVKGTQGMINTGIGATTIALRDVMYGEGDLDNRLSRFGDVFMQANEDIAETEVGKVLQPSTKTGEWLFQKVGDLFHAGEAITKEMGEKKYQSLLASGASEESARAAAVFEETLGNAIMYMAPFGIRPVYNAAAHPIKVRQRAANIDRIRQDRLSNEVVDIPKPKYDPKIPEQEAEFGPEYEYLNGINPGTRAEITAWAHDMGVSTNKEGISAPIVKDIGDSITPATGALTRGPAGSAIHSRTPARTAENVQLVPFEITLDGEPRPRGVEPEIIADRMAKDPSLTASSKPNHVRLTDGVEVPYSHTLLPYNFFRAVYNKLRGSRNIDQDAPHGKQSVPRGTAGWSESTRTSGKPASEKTIRERYIEYVRSFLPDKALVHNFDTAVLHAFRAFEQQHITEQLLTPERIRKDVKASFESAVLEEMDKTQRLGPENALRPSGTRPGFSADPYSLDMSTYRGGKQGGMVDPAVIQEALAKGVGTFKDLVKWVQRKQPETYAEEVAVAFEIAQHGKKRGEAIVFPDRQDGRMGVMGPAKGPRNLGNWLGEIVGGRRITALKQDPYLKGLIDLMYPPEFQEPAGYTSPYRSAVEVSSGTWKVELSKVLRSHNWDKLSEAERLEAFRYVVGDKTQTHLSRRAIALGDSIKELTKRQYDWLTREAPELGTEYFPDWLPWRADKQAILKDGDGFVAAVQPYFQKRLGPNTHDPVSGMSANELAWDLAMNLVSDDGRLIAKALTYSPQELINAAKRKQKLVAKKDSSLDYARTLKDIPHADLKKWVEWDIEKLLGGYIDSMVKRVEYTKRFGANNEKVLEYISAAMEAAAKDGKQIQSWKIRKIYDILNSEQQMYMRDFKSDHPQWTTAQAALGTASNLVLLPYMTIASLGEATYGLHRVTVDTYAKAAVKTGMDVVLSTAARRAGRNMRSAGLSQTNGVLLANMMNKATREATHQALADLRGGVVGGLIGKVNTTFFRWVGAEHWMRSQNIFHANQYMGLMLKMSNKTKLSAYEQRVLDHANITLDELKSWKRSGASFERTLEDNVIGRKILEAGHAYVEQHVLTPNTFNTPQWHSNPALQFARYLKSFPALMGNTVVKNLIMEMYLEFDAKNSTQLLGGLSPTHAKQGLKVVGTFAAILAVSHLSNLIRDSLVYEDGENPIYEREIENPVARYMARAMERSGALSWGGLVWDAFMMMRRGSGEGPFETAAGAWATQGVQLMKALTTWRARPVARQLAKMTPGLNLTQPMRDRIAEQYYDLLVDYTSLEPSKRSTNMPGLKRL